MGPHETATRWVAWRTFRSTRTSLVVMSILLLVGSVANIVGYRKAFPTAADRAHLATELASNAAARLFYGVPYDLSHIGGYAAWRLVGLFSIFAAAWGLFVTISALRGEEEAGRWEMVLSGRVGRRGALVAALGAILAGVAIMWASTAVGIVVAGKGDMAFGESLYLALAIVISAAVFAALAALLCQLIPTVHSTRVVGGSLLGAFLLMRIAADVSSSAGWLRWLTPFGWVEEMRPFTGAQPLVVLLPLGAIALTAGAAWEINQRRDVGNALFLVHGSARSRDWLLGSPTQEALRAELHVLVAWLIGTVFFAAVVGMLAKDAAKLIKSSSDLARTFGSSKLGTPEGYLSFAFLFFVLAVCLVALTNVTAAREEEASGRLETLLAEPVSRLSWLGGRLIIAMMSAAAVALVAGVAAWVGASSQGANVGLGRMLGATANCLPITILFLGLAALIFAVAPRVAAGVSYGLVGVAYLWELFGPALKAPGWVLDLSPFHHVAQVPSSTFDVESAIVMLIVGLATLLAGLELFTHRDLVQT